MVKSYYFLNHQFKKRFGVLKRIVSIIKDANNFVSICFYLVKILPLTDQFIIIMFDNMYVKHKPSNSGHKILTRIVFLRK